MGFNIYDGTGSINLTVSGYQMCFYNRGFDDPLPPYPNTNYQNGRTYVIDSDGNEIASMPNLMGGEPPINKARVGNRNSNGTNPSLVKTISSLPDDEHTLKIVYTSSIPILVYYLQITSAAKPSYSEYELFGCSKNEAFVAEPSWSVLSTNPLKVLPATTQGQSATEHIFYVGLSGYGYSVITPYFANNISFDDCTTGLAEKHSNRINQFGVKVILQQ